MSLGPWHIIGMDFITSLLESQGDDVILVMIDWYAKLAYIMRYPKWTWSLEPILKELGEFHKNNWADYVVKQNLVAVWLRI